jgi:hypothetical protein
MLEATPQLSIGPAPAAAESKGLVAVPTELPPTSAGADAADDQARSALVIDTTMPTVSITEAVTGWQDNKQIVGLWSINQPRNVFLGIAGVGWKKLADNSDSASMALTQLGAHARAKGAVVRYREEADGKIHEMYVW